MTQTQLRRGSNFPSGFANEKEYFVHRMWTTIVGVVGVIGPHMCLSLNERAQLLISTPVHLQDHRVDRP